MGTYEHLTIAEQSYIDRCSKIVEDMNIFLINTYGLYYDKGYKLYIEDGSYSLYLNMANQDRPTIISGDFDNDEDFTQYLIKEMQRKGLFRNEYFTLYHTDENGKI